MNIEYISTFVFFIDLLCVVLTVYDNSALVTITSDRSRNVRGQTVSFYLRTESSDIRLFHLSWLML